MTPTSILTRKEFVVPEVIVLLFGTELLALDERSQFKFAPTMERQQILVSLIYATVKLVRDIPRLILD